MTKYQNNKNKKSGFENIVIMIGSALWQLITLPFKKKKSGDVIVRWKEVQELMVKDDVHAWTMAIIKADSILDSVLQKRVSGNTVGERLKAMENKINRDTLQSAWDAHKVRNQIAHGDKILSNPPGTHIKSATKSPMAIVISVKPKPKMQLRILEKR